MSKIIIPEQGILDPDEGLRNRDAFLESVQWDASQIKRLRRLCKVDLGFLCTFMLGYSKLSPQLHGHLIQWMKETIEEQYRLVLMPRSHYKTTVYTKGDAIQIALPDDLGDQPYPRNLGNEVRMLISHEKAGAAERILFEIANHFISNPKMLALFPECQPQERIQRINTRELELPRMGQWGEPTFDTMGAGGKNQGRHYHIIKADDIYGSDARDSKKERETLINWFDNIQSFLITPKTDHIDVTGTRWAFDDVYAHMIKVYGDAVAVYTRAAEELNPKTGKKEPIFPEEFSTESLAILKKNRKVWSAQYANNPTEGSAKFSEAWLQYYTRVGRNIVIRDGFNDDNDEIIRFEELDRIIFIDPAVSGLSGFVVTGTDRKKRIFTLEATKRAFRPDELVNYLFSAVLKWQPRIVVIEFVLFSEVFEPWLRREMQVRGIRFRIEGARTQQKAKEVRIDGLTPYFSAGQIYFADEGQEELIEEFKEFGGSDNVHMLDAMAYGPKFWKYGVNQKLLSRYAEAESAALANRDPWGGYSL